MYGIISAVIGVLIAIMILFNGAMSNTVGNGTALVLIHITGLLTVVLVLLIQKMTRSNRLAGELIQVRGKTNIPWYLLTAGALGIFTVTFNNVSFLNIGMSLTLALGLLGQSLTAVLIDHFGVLGMEKVKFRKKKMIGLGMILIGIVIMTIL